MTTSVTGRSDVLVDAGQTKAAIEVLRALERILPNSVRLSIATGDIYRRDEQCENALESYGEAVSHIERFSQDHWFLFQEKLIQNQLLGILLLTQYLVLVVLGLGHKLTFLLQTFQ